MPLRLLARDLFDPQVQAHYNYITQIRTVTQVHDHDFCELFLVAEGSVRHQAAQKVQTLPRGSLVLVRHFDRHGFLPVEDQPCGIMNLAFPTALLLEALDYLFGNGKTCPLWTAELPPTVHLAREETAQAIRRLQSLSAMGWGDAPAQRRQIRQALMSLLIDHFCKTPATGPAGPIPSWLADLYETMRQPEHFTLGLPHLLASCPKSKEHLYRQFKKHYGQTPSAYLNALRINYAANLLRNTDRGVVEIAMEAGFDNLGYFYARFKQQYGIPPQRFRGTRRAAGPVP